MTIRVYYRASPKSTPVVIEFDEAKTDPFQVCNAVRDRMFPAGESAGGVERGTAFARPVVCPPPAATGVRDTSKAAYSGLRYSGALTVQQKLVLTTITFGSQHDWTRQELARATGLGINAICGRVNELLHDPFRCLVECGRRRCGVTGENVNVLRLEGSSKTMEKAA